MIWRLSHLCFSRKTFHLKWYLRPEVPLDTLPGHSNITIVLPVKYSGLLSETQVKWMARFPVEELNVESGLDPRQTTVAFISKALTVMLGMVS